MDERPLREDSINVSKEDINGIFLLKFQRCSKRRLQERKYKRF